MVHHESEAITGFGQFSNFVPLRENLIHDSNEHVQQKDLHEERRTDEEDEKRPWEACFSEIKHVILRFSDKHVVDEKVALESISVVDSFYLATLANSIELKLTLPHLNEEVTEYETKHAHHKDVGYNFLKHVIDLVNDRR